MCLPFAKQVMSNLPGYRGTYLNKSAWEKALQSAIKGAPMPSRTIATVVPAPVAISTDFSARPPNGVSAISAEELPAVPDGPDMAFAMNNRTFRDYLSQPAKSHR
jgi:hypothetical protein